jgi:hypothetical protein
MLNVPPTLRRCTRPAPRAHNGLKVDMSPRLNERRLCAMVRCAGERLLRAQSSRHLQVPKLCSAAVGIKVIMPTLRISISLAAISS